jgi:hypothetical protein
VTIAWTAPEDGGCAVSSYAILRDGGPSSTTFTEVHSTEVNNNANLNQFTVTDLPTSILGHTLKLKVSVTNIGGYTNDTCEALAVVVADVPSTPASGPVSDVSVTTVDIIRITYAAPASDGGSLLTNYEVQMDDGIGGGFTTIAGGSLGEHSVLHALVQAPTFSGTVAASTAEPSSQAPAFSYTLIRGRSYRFQYRAQNLIGWSQYSPTTSITAASQPDAPSTVTYVSSSASAIKVQVN